MSHFLGAELVSLERAVAFLYDESSFAREDPFVALSRTDTAVADHEGGYLWDLDVELEGSAVAVAIVSLELRG